MRNNRMTVAVRVIAALLLVGVAIVLRNEGTRSRNEAAAWQKLITLQFEGPIVNDDKPEGWLASVVSSASGAHQRAATVDYWLGQYDDLAASHAGANDPDVLFISANAAFRAARRGRPVGPDAARKLDPVLQAYSGVLKADPRYRDAAFNYEYVSRLRDQLSLLKPNVGSAPMPARPIQVAGLPVGPTVHGVPGGPPLNAKPNEVEILRPREVGERESGPDQAPGGTARRKG